MGGEKELQNNGIFTIQHNVPFIELRTDDKKKAPTVRLRKGGWTVGTTTMSYVILASIYYNHQII